MNTEYSALPPIFWSSGRLHTKRLLLPISRARFCWRPFFKRVFPATRRWSIRIGPLELAQQPGAALDRGVECCLRRFLAGKRLLQLLLRGVAQRGTRSEPQAFRVLGRHLQGDLLDGNRGTRITVVKTLDAGEVES